MFNIKLHVSFSHGTAALHGFEPKNIRLGLQLSITCKELCSTSSCGRSVPNLLRLSRYKPFVSFESYVLRSEVDYRILHESQTLVEAVSHDIQG